MKRAALFFSLSIAATCRARRLRRRIIRRGTGAAHRHARHRLLAPLQRRRLRHPRLLRAPASTEVPTLTRTTVVSGLQNPWDLAFTPDGTMLFTEKCRGLSARFANGTTVRLFGTAGSSLVAPDLFCEGQSGVHGVAVDPDFATGTRYVYVFMASNLTTNPRTNRVVRLQLSADTMSASNRTDIITDIAYKDVANAVGGAGAHSGGRVRFGPDRLSVRDVGRQPQRHAAAGPDAPRRQGAARRSQRRRGAGQQHTRRRRPAHLHLRPSQRAGHHVPSQRASRTPASLSRPSMARITATKSRRWSRAAMPVGIRRTGPA